MPARKKTQVTTVKKTYKMPPTNSTVVEWVRVGMLNINFANYNGPQRNRPGDSKSYLKSLSGRANAYGDFQWELLRYRVVSRRADGVLYPLDGNGSNHWLENQFGPNFEVPCIMVDDLTLAEENNLFQKLQVVKKVTPTEKYRVDLEFDKHSRAVQIEKALSAAQDSKGEALGFFISQSTSNPHALGRTTAEFIEGRYNATALTTTLELTAALFDEGQQARTNGALVKALAILLHKPGAMDDYDKDRLFAMLTQAGAAATVGQARGGSGEIIVLQTIADMYNAMYN
jgi:hypothetical protein